MGQAIGQSLPIAVGILVFPIPIASIILLLVTPRARANGVAFVVGWSVSLLMVGSGLVWVLGSAAGGGASPAWMAWARIALGTVAVALAAKQWRSRPRNGQDPPTPRWMAALDAFTPGKSLTLGAALAVVNPKNLLLLASAAATIASATPYRPDRLVAVVAFTVVASLGVVTPLVVSLVRGEEATARLAALRTWLVGNNATVMAVLLLVLGAKVIGDGVSML